MKSKKKITIIYGDDWEGLYVDGKLVAENHQLSDVDVLNAMKIGYDSFEADGDWLGRRGRLPESLDDVKLLDG